MFPDRSRMHFSGSVYFERLVNNLWIEIQFLSSKDKSNIEFLVYFLVSRRKRRCSSFRGTFLVHLSKRRARNKLLKAFRKLYLLRHSFYETFFAEKLLWFFKNENFHLHVFCPFILTLRSR